MRDLEHASTQELAEMKVWLFQENVRIETAKREFEEIKRSFEQEKETIIEQLKDQTRKQSLKERQLDHEKELFEKKWKILERGFAELNADRRKLERDRQVLESEREKVLNLPRRSQGDGEYEIFFRGVSSQHSLKKRYRELMKIFHPDNQDGDTDTIQLINHAYSSLKRVYGLKA